jgi:hypothetical protein
MKQLPRIVRPTACQNRSDGSVLSPRARCGPKPIAPAPVVIAHSAFPRWPDVRWYRPYDWLPR